MTDGRVITMATTLQTQPVDPPRSLADLVEELGGIALERIRAVPVPGTATVDDVIHNNDELKTSPCELIDGILVEKARMSYIEDSLTTVLAYFVHGYLRDRRIGKGFTAGAMYKLVGGNVRLPDFSVCLNDKFPSGRVERVPYVDFAPDLAVEVLSQSNTLAEIDRKRRELFASGTQLMWVVDPGQRTVDVYRSIDSPTTLTEADTLTGADLLPGFAISIADWFREAEEV